jgi:hypothetical protein
MSLVQAEKRYVFKGTYGKVKKGETTQSHIDADEFERLLNSIESGRATESAQ